MDRLMETLYKVVGCSNGNREILEEDLTLVEAKTLLKEYILAFGQGWIISLQEQSEPSICKDFLA